MSTILITGNQGFIGNNLTLFLEEAKYKVIGIDIDHTDEDLLAAVSKADFIIHLAGINRNQNIEDFKASNVDFTTKLINLLETLHKSTPIIVSSSTQALLDNPYGRSKKDMEDIILNWAARTHNKVFVFRLANVFGKWCRPNYNSVVATFCYNLAHNLPLVINDPSTTLQLCYIDDIAINFIDTIQNVSYLDTGIYEIAPVYCLTLSELAHKLTEFSQNQKTLLMPSLEGHFNKALYSTYLSYLEPTQCHYTLSSHTDSRGTLTELFKSLGCGQFFVSTTKPGITRGNHWHHTKTEKFIVLQGQATISLRSILDDTIITFNVSDQPIEIIDIPPGYTHNITNSGTNDLITLFWANEIFNSKHPDTHYEEVNKHE